MNLSCNIESEIPLISRKAPLVISQVIHVRLPAADSAVNICSMAANTARGFLWSQSRLSLEIEGVYLS